MRESASMMILWPQKNEFLCQWIYLFKKNSMKVVLSFNHVGKVDRGI